jgi:Holliday junction DNA helicase RuvB
MLAVYFGIRQIIAERHILATFEITDTEPPEEDPIDEPHKRKKFPFTLSEFAGQPEITKSLTMYMDPRVLKDGVLEHILFFGMAGLGKTTLSEIVAATLEKPFIELEGNSLNNKDAIIALAKKITPGCIVFIDEIHQIKPQRS